MQENNGVNSVAVALYKTGRKEQIAAGAMGYAKLDDMDDWNRYLINELMMGANITRSSTAGGIASGGTAKDEKKTEAPPEYSRHWLYLGVRGGYSMRFYTEPNENFAFNFDSPFDLGHTFEAGIRAAGQVFPWLAIQAEGIFTMDTAVLRKSQPGSWVVTEYKSMSFMFPFVAKVTFRPGQWLIAPFGGVYISVPLGEMIISQESSIQPSEWTADWEWDKWMGLGWTAGLEVGRRLGPGTLFLDIRYSAGLANAHAYTLNNMPASIPMYRHTAATVSLGYDFALFKKKSK